MDLIYRKYKLLDKKLKRLSVRNYDILNAYYAFLFKMKFNAHGFHATRDRLLMI